MRANSLYKLGNCTIDLNCVILLGLSPLPRGTTNVRAWCINTAIVVKQSLIVCTSMMMPTILDGAINNDRTLWR